MRHNGFVEWTHNGGRRGRHSYFMSAPLWSTHGQRYTAAHATKLTWEDLFLQDPQFDFARIFGCWPQLRGKTLPFGLSAFGDAFFAKPDDSVWVLDTFTGEVRKVAASQAEFADHMNSQPWQEQNLRSELVFELRERGMERGPLQVFAPVPHPAHAGAIRLERAQVLDAVVWHSISSQAVAQTSGSQKNPWWKVW